MMKFLALVALAFSYVVVGCTAPHVDETNLSNPPGRDILVIYAFVDKDGDGHTPFTSGADACSILDEAYRQRCLDAFESGEINTVAGPLSFGDCDDDYPTVYKGAPELCDGKDNDCDGQTDEGLVNCECQTNANCATGEVCTDHLCYPASCDDGDYCTTDGLPTAAGCPVKTNVPGCCHVDNQCLAGQYCQDTNHSCQTVPACGDSNGCTADSFDLALETCVNAPIPGCQCDASNDCLLNQYCTTNSHICEQVPCVVSDNCHTAAVVTHVCVQTAKLNGTSCADADLCDGTETCNSGVCSSTGTLLSCDDADPCTIDSCVVATGCAHAAIEGCYECTVDANCASTVPVNFVHQSGGWWHLGTGTGSVSFGCLAGFCGACVDADNDGFCAMCQTDANCPVGNTCETLGSGVTDKTCVPQECVTNANCPSGQTCVLGSCQAPTCIPSCSGKVCGDNGCGGSCGSCGTGMVCSATSQCVTGNTCTTDAQCADSDAASADICFGGTCYNVFPGQCGPFGLKFVPFSGTSGGPLEWWKAGSTSTPRTQNSVTAGTYLSQTGECSVAVYNFHLTESRCITANGESPLKELSASPGVWGCVFNQ